MDLQSPYLEAIQAVPGSAPGDKYRKLNLVSKGIAETLKPPDDSSEIPVPAAYDIPPLLVPLVQLQSADLMRQHNIVVKCITTEDSILVRKALKMHWFFRGGNKKIINTDYFEKHLLPYLSLQTRGQVIKRLAMNLRTSGEEKTAEEFYTFLARTYGRKQAEPLLVACSADFIYDTITTNKLVLSCRTVRILFVKYPEVVVSYMKLSNPNSDRGSGKCYDIDIHEYSHFLPRLIKNHLSDFIELLEMHNSSLGVRLSNKATETFLKSNVDALLKNPKLYIKLMPFKIIAAKLTKQQYKVMFLKLFPKQQQQFSERSISTYLDYYPEQERMALAIDSYREVYNANLLDNTEVIDTYFMRLLPAEERARQARIKLAQEPDWRSNRYDIRKIWRCYLPLEESIPTIKTDIAKSPVGEDRSSLLCQMFYTCTVHEDKDALLEALQYFTTRHKNEQSCVIFEVLDKLADMIDLYTIGKDHWAVLDDFIQFLRITDQLDESLLVSRRILVAGIHFNLIHNLPIEGKIEIILDLNMRKDLRIDRAWNLLEKHPEYERRCFETFLSIIPKKYPDNDEIWRDQRRKVVYDIVKAIYDFNIRNTKVNSKIEKLSIKNFPWLLEATKAVVQTEEKDVNWQVLDVTRLLKIHDNDLHNAWTRFDSQRVVSVESGDALARLAKDPKHILENWEEYLMNARKCIIYSSDAKRFIKATRWYQGIPIKFTTECIKDVSHFDSSAIMVLSMLVEGDVFARIVKSVTSDFYIDPEDEHAKAKYQFISSIASVIKIVEPPMPIELVLNLCQSDHLKLGLIALTNVCRRSAPEKVQKLVDTLVNSRVSVKKHGIRQFCLVGTIDSRRLFLWELWKTENHMSIRAVVLISVYDLFINDPTSESWLLMKNCIAELQVDDEHCFKALIKLSPIPDQYIADYIQQLLDSLEKLVAKGYSATLAAQYVSFILRSISGELNVLMPECFCEQLIRKYFCNPSLHLDVSSAGITYAVRVYLESAEDKLSSRLAIICRHYEDVLKNHWNVPHPKVSSFFPINYLAHEFITKLVYFKVEDDDARTVVMEAVLKSFLNVLKPQCDYVAYALLIYGIALRNIRTLEGFIEKIGETLPRLVDVLSLEMVVFLADVIETWIQRLFAADQVDVVIYALVESLCKIGTDSACLLAVKLLYLATTKNFENRRTKIFKFLRESKCSSVVSLVYQHTNTSSPPNL